MEQPMQRDAGNGIADAAPAPRASRSESWSREPEDCRSILPFGSVFVSRPAHITMDEIQTLEGGARQRKALLLRRPMGAIMAINTDRMNDSVLALLLLGQHNGQSVWKSFDWDAIDRLHKKG